MRVMVDSVEFIFKVEHLLLGKHLSLVQCAYQVKVTEQAINRLFVSRLIKSSIIENKLPMQNQIERVSDIWITVHRLEEFFEKACLLYIIPLLNLMSG